MTQHFKEICVHCNDIISQCRCASPDKVTKYGVCNECKIKTTDLREQVDADPMKMMLIQVFIGSLLSALKEGKVEQVIDDLEKAYAVLEN